MSDTILIVWSGGRRAEVERWTVRETSRTEDNMLADSLEGALALAERTVARGDGWAIWPSGAGSYCVRDIIRHH